MYFWGLFTLYFIGLFCNSTAEKRDSESERRKEPKHHGASGDTLTICVMMRQCLADGLFLMVSRLRSGTISPRWLHTVLCLTARACPRLNHPQAQPGPLAQSLQQTR